MKVIVKESSSPHRIVESGVDFLINEEYVVPNFREGTKLSQVATLFDDVYISSITNSKSILKLISLDTGSVLLSVNTKVLMKSIIDAEIITDPDEVAPKLTSVGIKVRSA